MEVPLATIPNATVSFPLGAMITAKGDTIDQNMACEQATPIRDKSTSMKLLEIAATIWFTTKNPITQNNNFRYSVLENKIINGSDNVATPSA